jgi:DNA-binding NtrC family response regulator
MPESTVNQIDEYYRLIAERTARGELERRPLRFLFIDDDEEFNQMVQITFGKSGIVVDSALTANEGHRKAVSQTPPYTLIVLDVVGIGKPLPDAFRDLKRDLPSVPVAICTGYAAAPEIQECLKYGNFWLLDKPLDIKRLAGIFEHYRDMLAPQN